MDYQVPEIFQPKELVESGRVNRNNKYITDNLGLIKDQADKSTSDIETKVDKSQIGIPNGLATLDDKGTLTQSEIPDDVARLDDSGVLREDQIPEKTLTHIFTANSLGDMLSLHAQQGDWCKRLDIGKVYVLTSDLLIGINGWLDMGSVSINNTLLPFPPYVGKLNQDSWTLSEEDDIYLFSINAQEHKQSYLGTDALFVCCYDHLGNNIFVNYSVDEYNTVTLMSNIPIEGKVVVTNFSDSLFGINTVPNSIISSYQEDNKNKFLSITSDGSITINTDSSFIFVDSNKNLRTINGIGTKFDEESETNVSCFPLNLSNLSDGLYHIFINSSDISISNNLRDLVFIKYDNYFNQVNSLPTVSENSVYINNNESKFYSLADKVWIDCNLCHIGQIVISNGLGQIVYNDDYNQNGYNTNLKSNNKDYLAKGLDELNIKINDKILIKSGQVLLDNKSRIIDIDNLSLIIPKLANSDLNWYDIYLCGNDYGENDLSLLSHGSDLKLSSNFSSSYKICSLPAINKQFLRGETINNVLYFETPLDLFNGSCNNGITIDIVPDNIKCLYCSVENNSEQEFNFGIQTFEEKEIQVSKEYMSYEVTMEDESGTIVGYINSNGIIGEFIPNKTIVYSDKELENELATSEGNDFKWTGNAQSYSKIEKQVVIDIKGPVTNSISIKNKQTIKIPYKGKFTVQGGNNNSNLKIKLLGYEIR